MLPCGRVDTFVEEHDRLPPEDIHTTRQNNHMERERPSISSFFWGEVVDLPLAAVLRRDFQRHSLILGTVAGKEKAPEGACLSTWKNFWSNEGFIAETHHVSI